MSNEAIEIILIGIPMYRSASTIARAARPSIENMDKESNESVGCVQSNNKNTS